jgi:hypothetical protein
VREQAFLCQASKFGLALWDIRIRLLVFSYSNTVHYDIQLNSTPTLTQKFRHARIRGESLHAKLFVTCITPLYTSPSRSPTTRFFVSLHVQARLSTYYRRSKINTVASIGLHRQPDIIKIRIQQNKGTAPVNIPTQDPKSITLLRDCSDPQHSAEQAGVQLLTLESAFSIKAY